MKYQMVDRLRAEYSVECLCRGLKVARSGYYAWRKRAPSRREQADTQLKQQIADIFESSYQTYGSPRIHAALGKAGYRCGRRRVMRLMREQGLSAQQGRRRMITTCAN